LKLFKVVPLLSQPLQSIHLSN